MEIKKYKGDKLNSNQFVEDLFNVFENFTYKDGDKQGFSMTLNGEYGSGKTTILNFIKEENEYRNKKFDIIEYNAWENNFFDNPLIPILYTLSNLRNKWGKVKDFAFGILKSILKNGVGIFTKTLSNAHNVDLTDVSSFNNFFVEYKDYLEAVNKFKQVLGDCCREKKIILLVDELDRCLPEYQVKVLESLYHILNVPGLIVVVAIDNKKLENSVQTYFGNNNVFGYLSKFFQYSVNLPIRDSFIYLESLLNFKTSNDEEVKKIIIEMLKVTKLSLRECQLIINELNIFCQNISQFCDDNLEGYSNIYPILIAFILITKYLNFDIYQKYFLTQINRNFIDETVLFKNSRFYNFIKEIENTKLDEIVELLKKFDLGVLVLIYILFVIDNPYKMNKIELAAYFKMELNSFTTKFIQVSSNSVRLNNINKVIKILRWTKN